MKVAAHVAYGNVSLKCPACTGPDAEALRDMEGCDFTQRFGEPTIDAKGKVYEEFKGHAPRMSITCTLCAGRDASCPVCRGGGEEPVFQCPGTVCDIDTARVMQAYTDYQNGILPDAGGMYDQSAPFVDMMRVVGSELAALQAEDRKHAKSKKSSTNARR